MIDLEHFTALIQLISAVNFAYITLRFHEKIFKIIFSLPKSIAVAFDNIKSTYTLDITSLRSMDPLRTTNDLSLEDSILKLANKYEELPQKWSLAYKRHELRLNYCMSAEGVKSLFLFISIYCILDLFLIALIGTNTNVIAYKVSLRFLNINTSLISLGYIIRTCFKNPKYSPENLYSWAIVLSSFNFLATLIVGLLSYFGKITINNQENTTLCCAILSVALPFLPCLWTVIYCISNIIRIKIELFCTKLDIRIKLLFLKYEKCKLDKVSKLFSRSGSNPPAQYS